MGKTPHNDWDTPVNGDFASYVERLSAVQIPQSVAPSHPIAAQAPQAAQAAPAQAAPAPEGDGVESALAGKLRAVRIVVFLVFTAQALVLLFLQKGSLPLLFFTGMVWFFLGRMQSALLLTLPRAEGADRSTPLQRLRDELQRTARERAAANTTQKPKKK